MKRNTFYPLSNSMFSFPFEISSESLCSSCSTSILYIIVFSGKMEVISIAFFFLSSHQNYLESFLHGNIILSSTYLKILSASAHCPVRKPVLHFQISMQDTGCLGLVHWDDPEGWSRFDAGYRKLGAGKGRF